MDTRTALDRRLILFLAEKYDEEGYEVIVESSPERLPEFLSGYKPDLVLHKKWRPVIVEVKTREALAENPQVDETARLVREQPGWDFELAVVETGK